MYDAKTGRHRGGAPIIPAMRAILPLTLAAACVAAPVAQQDVAQTPAIVTTRHQVTIGGTVLRYTARAGTIPIRDNETGDVHAHMFFVAYTLDRAPGAPARPLTFLWNGGPGSNSGLVHLLGFGPKRITAATGTMPRYSPSGTALVDNQETWLDGERSRLRRSGRHGLQPADEARVRRGVLSNAGRRGVGRGVHPRVPDAPGRVRIARLPDGRELRRHARVARRRGADAAADEGRRRDPAVRRIPARRRRPGADAQRAEPADVDRRSASSTRSSRPICSAGRSTTAIRASMAYAEGEYASALARRSTRSRRPSATPSSPSWRDSPGCPPRRSTSRRCG